MKLKHQLIKNKLLLKLKSLVLFIVTTKFKI